jgi:D-3-phosphoglycerate dehydrogenase
VTGYGLADMKDPVQIELHQTPPLIEREILQWSAVLMAGIVYQYVDGAQVGFDAIYGNRHDGLIRHVEARRQDLAAVRRESLSGYRQTIGIPAVQDDPCAGGRQSLCQREPDTAAGAGHQCQLPFQIKELQFQPPRRRLTRVRSSRIVYRVERTMSKPDLLIVCPLTDDLERALESDYGVHRLWKADDQSQLLRQIGPSVRGVATRGDFGASAALMAALPALEVVGVFGVGVDAVDLGYARARGIRVTNTPGVLTDDVADMGMALLLTTARQIVAGDHHVRSGAWLRGPMRLTTSLNGKRLGILGLGRIGQALARRASAFNMSIAYCNPRRKTDAAYDWYSDPVSLAKNVDCFVICAAAGPSTRQLVGMEVLDALGPRGILINIARGLVVEEAALLRALRERRIAAAGLDVFMEEPNINPEFATLDNVVLQPHNGSGTIETRAAIGRLLQENLAAHFSGAPLPTPVS